LCSKGFDFEGLPTDRPLVCPDCGSPATIIDTSELLERKKGNISAITGEMKSPLPPETHPSLEM
jgi:transcription initiation factor IIE alpha subunit